MRKDSGAQLFIHDGADSLANALHAVYGPVGRQRCICHKLDNVWDAAEHKTNTRASARKPPRSTTSTPFSRSSI
ncbi:hypothetical protein HQ560_10955 [bacterium]|nr:hypothetical protein [bacterium]